MRRRLHTLILPRLCSLPPADEKSLTTLRRLWTLPDPYDGRLSGKRVGQSKWHYAGVSLMDWDGGRAGAGLRMIVINAYITLSWNWSEGDEVFLFGYGTGAYAARMVAALINEVGIIGKVRSQVPAWIRIKKSADTLLHVQDADRECRPVFLALDRRAKHPNDATVRRVTDATLAPYRARRDAQLQRTRDGFLVK
jgi:hypothetical protein